MAIPERMIPVKVSSKKIRELAQKAKEILIVEQVKKMLF